MTNQSFVFQNELAIPEEVVRDIQEDEFDMPQPLVPATQQSNTAVRTDLVRSLLQGNNIYGGTVHITIQNLHFK